MKTPPETTVVPAVDGKEEPKPKLAVPSGKKVLGKKTPKAVTKKLAPKKAQKAGRKAKKPAAKKVTKPATKKLKRREFPYKRVLKMWKAGKTMETIARATGRYHKDAADPLHSFRVSLTRFHRGVKIGGKTVSLPHRIGKKALKAATKAGKRAAR